MFRVVWFTPSVLGLYHGSDRAEFFIPVVFIFCGHEIMNNSDEGHARVHGVANGCVATGRIPAQQSLAP